MRPLTRTLTLILGLATGGLFATTGLAQNYCGPRDVVIDRLISGFGEALTAGGLRSQSSVLEIWAAPDTGTWTVLITRADGIACVMASGTDWHQRDRQPVPMGEPS